MTKIAQDNSDTDQRYEARPDSQARGQWVVVDTHTGLPAASDGKDFTSLSKRDAADIAEALNTYLKEGKEPPLV